MGSEMCIRDRVNRYTCTFQILLTMISERAFRHAVISDDERKRHLTERIPHNTQSKQRWAVQLFQSWHQEWKCRLDGTLKVYKALDEMERFDLNESLKIFLPEVRRVYGRIYPPKTLKEIVAMLQHYCINTLKKKWSIFMDKEFQESREALDAEMRISAREGNVAIPKRSDPISMDEENRLWESGALGSSSPAQLQNTLIYVLGIELGLRAASDHKMLTFGTENDQLTLVDGKYLLYKENVSKSRHFGLKQCRLEPKVVKLLPNPEAP